MIIWNETWIEWWMNLKTHWHTQMDLCVRISIVPSTHSVRFRERAVHYGNWVLWRKWLFVDKSALLFTLLNSFVPKSPDGEIKNEERRNDIFKLILLVQSSGNLKAYYKAGIFFAQFLLGLMLCLDENAQHLRYVKKNKSMQK